MTDRYRRAELDLDLLPPRHEVDQLALGEHRNPHGVLGAHPAGPDTVVRTWQPGASSAWVLANGERHAMTHVAHGLFVGLVSGRIDDHRLAVERDDRVETIDDPYRWPSTVNRVDAGLISTGRHERLWEVLGAHERTRKTPHGPVSGVSFAVWAPGARGVRVAGDFNGWDGRRTPMRSLDTSGVWEVFVPGVAAGCRYKFRVLGRDGAWHEHADPVAFATERPPATASVVSTSNHSWHDQDWMARRAGTDWSAEPVSIYEVHLGSWRPGLSYRDIAKSLGEYVREMGFTHVELLPVTEHPFAGSWGYQVTSYFAPTARFGSPDEIRYLVDHLHTLGIGVILDWVPAHFPRDAWALARFDGTPLYEHADARRGEYREWGTYAFNLESEQVRNFLIASALYWLTEFHFDGIRVDAVAAMLYLDYSRPEGEWLPNVHGGRENLDAIGFLRELNATVRRRWPGAMVIAEESTAWPNVTGADGGGLGFEFKWNMGWMHDTLGYLRHDPLYRAHHHAEITFSLSYAWDERFVLPLSHDEVVHGKGSLWQRMPGDDWSKAAGLRVLLAYQWAHPGKQLLFMGGEFGQPWEWNVDAGLGWHLLAEHGGMNYHRGIQRLVADLNTRYRNSPALYTQDCRPEGFTWISAHDREHNVIAFLRHGADGTVLACVFNFAGVRHRDYRLGLPSPGPWREVLNTDLSGYGGSGVANSPGLTAEPVPYRDQPASASLDLPPSGAIWLVPAA